MGYSIRLAPYTNSKPERVCLQLYFDNFILYNYGMEKSQYQREYYEKNLLTIKERKKSWYMQNRERLLLKSRGYDKTHSKEKNAKRKFYPSYGMAKSLEPKKIVFKHYGNKCFCCGEENLKLLSIDHIADNGREHGNGKRRHKGYMLYRFLLDNSFPTGIQIACFNCNIGRRNNYGICPHKDVQNEIEK